MKERPYFLPYGKAEYGPSPLLPEPDLDVNSPIKQKTGPNRLLPENHHYGEEVGAYRQLKEHLGPETPYFLPLS
jgi:hypothetical protein